MITDCNEIDVLLVPVGGGGLIAGCSLAAKTHEKDVEAIVELNLSVIV